jgi:hypothetical protein
VYVLLLFGFLTKINPFVEFIPPAATPSVISASVIVSYVIFADVSLALTIRLPLILVESKIALYETDIQNDFSLRNGALFVRANKPKNHLPYGAEEKLPNIFGLAVHKILSVNFASATPFAILLKLVSTPPLLASQEAFGIDLVKVSGFVTITSNFSF